MASSRRSSGSRRKKEKRKLILTVVILAAAAALVILAPKLLPCTADPGAVAPAEETVADRYANVPRSPYAEADFTEQDGRVSYTGKGGAKLGIDVSIHQDQIDWEAVKADGVDFAMIRVGYRGYSNGSLREDERALDNIREATQAGIKVGVYFFSQAISVEEAEEEAKFLLERIDGMDITYPVVYDWEPVSTSTRTAGMTDKMLTDCTAAFCETIKKAGYVPAFYYNLNYGYNHFDLDALAKYDQWLAEYNSYPSFRYAFQMWQFTDEGKVDGIDWAVDLNLCFKNYE